MTARDDSSVPSLSTVAPAGRAAGTATVTTALVLTLALQSAVPPFATDMYTCLLYTSPSPRDRS